MVAEWLERRTGGRVYYYGDSRDTTEADRFDGPARSALLDLMVRKPPYYVCGIPEYERQHKCQRCHQPMLACMWAGDTTGLACGVCDEHITVDRAGTVLGRRIGGWPAPHDHDINREVQQAVRLAAKHGYRLVKDEPEAAK